MYTTPTEPNRVVSAAEAVTVTLWFLFTAMCLTVAARLATRFFVSRSISFDSHCILLAMLFSIGQSVTVAIQIRTSSPVTRLDVNTDHFQKGQYAAELLYIPTLLFAKLSVLALLHQVTPVREHIKAIRLSCALVLLWTITSQTSTAFQCRLPHAWAVFSGHCFNRSAFWIVFGILNSFTDACIIFLPAYILWNLRISLKQKALITGAFFSRVCVIIATITRVIYLHKSLQASDKTAFVWNVIVCTQVEQNLSVVASCLPCLKPFFESLETGMLKHEVGIRATSKGSAGTSRFGQYTMDSDFWSRKTKSSKTRLTLDGTAIHDGCGESWNNITASHSLDSGAPGADSGSDKMIINHTREWNVESM